MSVDPSVIDALTAAVDASPGQHAVRLHLASLLVVAGDPERALEHARIVLVSVPDSLEGLAIARDAAQAVGNIALASSYERLLGISSAPAGSSPDERLAIADDDDPQSGGSVEDFERPRVTLADVGGMEDVKARLESAFLAPLRNPKLRDYYGKSLRGGLLLYGPPGCGKTFIARALAGELGAAFFAIGLSDVLDMWLGESERRLHEAFETARRSAPCVLFLDEIDALGRKRSQLRHSAGRNVINQLLAELDGAQADNEGVFVLAATNHPWDVDTALRRPGRLDRTVLVLPPDSAARAAILRAAMRGRPVEGFDVARIASKTDGLSGADLVHLCEIATERALADSIRSNHARPIGKADFDAALNEVSSSVRPWFSVAHGYAAYATEGGQYDDLLAYIRQRKML
jgi:SpoVK/Ycf46/Vps4 family AAA+-type ATPase